MKRDFEARLEAVEQAARQELAHNVPRTADWYAARIEELLQEGGQRAATVEALLGRARERREALQASVPQR
jgi:hypothetical protein